jgi:hypothetical protein
MVRHSSRPQTCRAHDSLRCHHPMELDLWHAWLCRRAHRSCQCHHQWSWYETEAVWAEWGWVGCCTPASGCSQGVYTILTILKLNKLFYIIRSSRMRHCSFPEERPASPPSYQPWTTSTNILPQLLSTTSTLWRLRRPSWLAKKPSTATTTKLITLRCSGLWRVCIFLLFYFFFLSMASITPSSQALILQKCGMTGWVDREGGGNCAYGIQPIIQIHGHKLGHLARDATC